VVSPCPFLTPRPSVFAVGCGYGVTRVAVVGRAFPFSFAVAHDGGK
jgi:hypothetical protein